MSRRLVLWLQILLACAAGGVGAVAGCQQMIVRGQHPHLDGSPAPSQEVTPYQNSAPTEMLKTSLPTYVIEPPDTLLIDAVKLVPKPPYKIEPLDVLQVLVVGTLNE